MSAVGLTPELIEAAAKLCGWERGRNSPGRAWYGDRCLLALEDTLLRMGWEHSWEPERGFWWYGRDGADSKFDHDRATAACLAAQAELEGK